MRYQKGRCAHKFIVGVACAMLLLWGGRSAEAATLKLASSAPQNSVWGQVLEGIGSDFRSITNGEVEVRIFHNGIAGSEPDVLRKVRLGQLDVAVLTSIGLAQIDDSILTVSVPGLISTADEFEYVLNRFGGSLQRRINDSSYEVLGWAGIAWIYPFAVQPFRRPEDVYRMKLGVSAGSENLTQFYRDLGYNPVPLPFSEWLTGLNSGLITGFFASPTAAAGFQWFGIAQNLVNIQLAPFLGALVISDRSWGRIDDAYKPRLKAAVARRLNSLTRESFALEESSIETMKRFDLNVIELSDSERSRWRNFFSIDDIIRAGGRQADSARQLFDISLHNSIKTALAEYRLAQ